MKARWWRAEPGPEPVQVCGLCFRRCRLAAGQKGFCGARQGGPDGLESPRLGRFAALAVDPIEKKPFRHWRPGTAIFSLGGLGCTMACPFCQNHALAAPGGLPPLKNLAPENLRATLRELGLTAVAYTYNEPTLAAEYILEAAQILKTDGVATVLVTNGLMTPEVLADLGPAVAAANVDVKTFNPETYRRLGGSLAAVRATVAGLLELGVHVELTALIVPGLSDDPEEFAALTAWAAGLDPNLPLHISRYFPAHKYAAPATDPDLLRQFKRLAESRLRRVHLGNLPPN
ncbi:AmmeMemoRadiSam system radical SAM enzyme [Deltaproteobacteria bacterium]|nr:AmmeMemoRadiSam system radical SAM enzyme [Deltaproteobacteria bacterium]